MKTWLITDTHFNHARMVELCGRPPDHTERIIRNWQKMVAEEDLVFHLGDVIFSRAAEVRDILAQLPGRKILIMGNHDFHHSEQWWMDRGFLIACHSMIYKGVLLSHIPVKELPHAAVLNVHGHLHNNGHRADCQTFPHNKLLAIEHTDYKPVEFNEFTEQEKRGKLILL